MKQENAHGCYKISINHRSYRRHHYKQTHIFLSRIYHSSCYIIIHRCVLYHTTRYGGTTMTSFYIMLAGCVLLAITVLILTHIDKRRESIAINLPLQPVV